MTFSLRDAWVWDFWTAWEAGTGLHHLFFLHAPASLGDPELRHRNARIGHAVSGDLRHWRRRPDPLPDVGPGAFDDLASWTGCTVHDGVRWWLFSTGLSTRDAGLVQRIGAATSSDLDHWTRTELVLEADGQHYQRSEADWPEEAWRDPWLVRDAQGRWHMYITARAADGGHGAGVVGHAVSDDLLHWSVQPPLSRPSGRFEWLEAMQVVAVDGRWALLFSCLSQEMPGADPGSGGVWSVPVSGPGAPVDVAAAVRIVDESSYVGKVVVHRGSPYFLAFRNRGPGGAFQGGLTAPVPVGWRDDGRGLTLAADAPAP